MARFRALCVPLGTHHSPDGTITATPQRVRHWIDHFHRLRQRGVRVPLAWGHSLLSMPCEDEDAFQLSLSKSNAGYITRMFEGADGGLWVEGEAPGVSVDPATGNLLHWTRLQDGREVQGSIGELSATIAPQWRDGRGEVWRDLVLHVGLVVLPVCGGQSGFERLSSAVRLPPGAVRLSTRTCRREGSTMPA